VNRKPAFSANSQFMMVNDVCEYLRISRSTVYRMRDAGELKPRQLSGRRIGFLRSEIESWVCSRPAA
jgi:excisionase family DNA binding protein